MKHVVRWLLVGIVLASPLIGDLIHFSLFPVAMAVVVAYHGLTPRVVFRSVVFLMVAEILWGIDFGVLSLAYIATVLVLRMAEYSVAITPVSRQSDWSVAPLVRGVILAWVLSLVMTLFSAFIQSTTYYPVGNVLGFTALTCAFGVMALHRIHVPFRKPITFGI